MEGIRKFDNQEFGEIRVAVGNDGEPWFVAKDVCDALGIRTDTVRSIVEADDVTEITNPNSIGVTHGRAPLIISEAGLYMLVLKSRKPDARRFQRWVTHDVLPAIRRDGGYMVARDETPEQTMARAVLIAQRTVERQRAEIDEMRPKALFADAVGASDGTCLVGEFAKMLRQNGVEIGQNRLFAWLREHGYLGSVGQNRNVPTQRSMDMGLFRIKETAITHADGHVTLNRTPKLTGKGQRYFLGKIGVGEVSAS